MVLDQLRLYEKSAFHAHTQNVMHRGHRKKWKFHSRGYFHLKTSITLISKARVSNLLWGNVFTRSLTISAVFLWAAIWHSWLGQRAWEDEPPHPEPHWGHQNKQNCWKWKLGQVTSSLYFHEITGIDNSVRPKSLANKLIESIYLFKTLYK